MYDVFATLIKDGKSGEALVSIVDSLVLTDWFPAVFTEFMTNYVDTL